MRPDKGGHPYHTDNSRCEKHQPKRGWIRSVTLKFNKACLPIDTVNKWTQTTERGTCSLSCGTQMQMELLKAPEYRAGSLGADSAKDTIMCIVGGIRYTLFVLREDTLSLDPRRDAAHCVLEKGPQGQKEVGDPWGRRGCQAEGGRVVTLSACRSIPHVFWNIPVSPRPRSPYTPQQSIIGKARLCKFRIEARLSHENQKALLPPAKVITRSKQQVRKAEDKSSHPRAGS